MNTEPWAQALEGMKKGVQMHLPDWLSGVRLRYQRLAIGWCLGAPLVLRLGLRLSQMMADDWVVPLAPLRSICYHP